MTDFSALQLQGTYTFLQHLLLWNAMWSNGDFCHLNVSEGLIKNYNATEGFSSCYRKLHRSFLPNFRQNASIHAKFGATCSNPILYKTNPKQAKACLGLLVRRKGFEPPTFWFVALPITIKYTKNGDFRAFRVCKKIAVFSFRPLVIQRRFFSSGQNCGQNFVFEITVLIKILNKPLFNFLTRTI